MQPIAWQRERAVVTELAEVLPGEMLAGLRAALAAPSAEEVSIAIIGAFNAGKSTLLNRLLHRSILPNRDFAETGTAIRIRNGAALTVSAIDYLGGRSTIEPTQEGIIDISSLLDCGGIRRPPDKISREVLIEIPDPKLPAGTTLIDTPGLNNGTTLNDRTLEIANEADRILYVLDSRYFLSESDLTSLALLLADRDPSTIHLVLNGFTDDPDEINWERFCADRLPYYRQRLLQRIHEVGLGEDHVDSLVVVCAAEPADGADLGLASFRHALEIIAAEARRDALAARKVRVALELQALKIVLRDKNNDLRRHLAEFAACEKQYLGECAANDALRAEIAVQVAVRQEEFAKSAWAVAYKVAESIKPWDLARYSSIVTNLQADLSRLALLDAAPFLEELGRFTKRPWTAFESSLARISEQFAIALCKPDLSRDRVSLSASLRMPQTASGLPNLRGAGALVSGVVTGAIESTIANVQRAADDLKTSIVAITEQAVEERRRRGPAIEAQLYDAFAVQPVKRPEPGKVLALEASLQKGEEIEKALANAIGRLAGCAGQELLA